MKTVAEQGLLTGLHRRHQPIVQRADRRGDGGDIFGPCRTRHDHKPRQRQTQQVPTPEYGERQTHRNVTACGTVVISMPNAFSAAVTMSLADSPASAICFGCEL